MMSKKTVGTRDREIPAQDLLEQEYTSVAVSSGGAATLQSWRNLRLIIGREYKNRVKARSFIITSIILLFFVFLAAFTPTIVQLITSGTNSQIRVVVVNEAGSIAGLSEMALTADINAELNGTTTGSRATYAISSQPSTDLGSLQIQVKNGKLDILLVLARATNQDLRFTYDTNVSSTDDSNLPTIQALAQQLTVHDGAYRLGLTPSQIRSLFAPASLSVVYTQQSQGNRPVSEIVAEFVLAEASGVLIFISVTIYASMVATGVVEEKSSRIMEILVNAATPFQLLAGKIVGIGAAGLTQMTCMVVVGIGGLLLQTPLQAALLGANAGGFIPYLTGVSIPFYLLFLLYFLLAFFLYATLCAGLGAMLKRQEEVQSGLLLPTLLILSGYGLIYLAVWFPDAAWVKVLSYVPFWTPTLMLVRLARGTVAWWEIVVTIALLLGTILACAWFAARLYRLGVLTYGQKPSLARLVKIVRTN
ncbi:MAG TPA: ABC transporter permease [Ktedonosporobacter sp.]|nr:ABC transporter permease [Ktedonosporobacter sp.]